MISEIDIEDMGPPQIEMVHLKENEDGSAVCQIRMNPAGARVLLEWGFNAMLLKVVNEVRTND